MRTPVFSRRSVRSRRSLAFFSLFAPISQPSISGPGGLIPYQYGLDRHSWKSGNLLLINRFLKKNNLLYEIKLAPVINLSSSPTPPPPMYIPIIVLRRLIRGSLSTPTIFSRGFFAGARAILVYPGRRRESARFTRTRPVRGLSAGISAKSCPISDSGAFRESLSPREVV